MRCNAQTGRCEALERGEAATARVFGSFSVVGAGAVPAFVAWVPSQQSLAHIESGKGGPRTTWIAGPARSGESVPAGRISVAAAGSGGSLHVAFLRDDGSLWYAVRTGGQWLREEVVPADKSPVGDSLAIAPWGDGAAIAFDHREDGRLGVVHKGSSGWITEWVTPPSLGDLVPDLGGKLALSAFGAKLAVAAHDRVGLDLWVATRNAGQWLPGIVAGREPSSGVDDGDAGLPCAMTRGIGGELVVAYRDATRNRVMVARSEGGHTKFQVVVDGKHTVPELGVVRSHLVGVDLDLVTLATGRLALGYQDGSRLRVGVAVEDVSGNFHASLAPHVGLPQLTPRVAPRVDGGVDLSWVQLATAEATPAGAITTWSTANGGSQR